MKKIINIALVLIHLQIVFSQNYTAKIERVDITGLYEIPLSPEVRSATKNNINSIRIVDGEKDEIPYTIFSKDNVISTREVFPILSKTNIPNASTTIIIANENLRKINFLALKIANTNLEKKYSISGSNDSKEWFGLVNNQIVNNLSEAGTTFVEREFSFPLNNYKYLKFDFVDKNSLPINIIEASTYKNTISKTSPLQLLGYKQKIETDKKETFVILSFQTPQIINAISFSISSPNYYLRDAEILIDEKKTVKNKEQTYTKIISTFSLNSRQQNYFQLSEIYTKELKIKINNEDNQPLVFEKIQLWQNPISILAELKKNKNYQLIINPNFTIPHYDIAQAGINYNKNYPIANIDRLEKIDQKSSNTSSKAFWQTPLFMWMCIAIASILILYFSILMIKDMNKHSE